MPVKANVERQRVLLPMIRVASIAASVLVSCATASADPPALSLPHHPSPDGRCTGDKGVGDADRSERSCLEQVGELARRAGPGLQLKFRNGATRVYLDEEAKCRSDWAAGCIRYRLAGYFPQHDLLLIEVVHWEGGDWLLVHGDSGKTSEIVAPPHYSPSKRWLVSVAASIGPAGPPNGIDIVPSTSDPALVEWHYRVPDEDDWLYAFAGWDGDDHAKLTVTSTGANARQAAASVDRRAGGWHLLKPE
jgi:hypothetical protein